MREYLRSRHNGIYARDNGKLQVRSARRAPARSQPAVLRLTVHDRACWREEYFDQETPALATQLPKSLKGRPSCGQVRLVIRGRSETLGPGDVPVLSP